jgi:hypothetical protein
MSLNWQKMAKNMKDFGCRYTPKQLSNPEFCITELAKRGYSIGFSVLRLEHLEEMIGRRVARPEAFTPPAIITQMKGPLYEQWGPHPTWINLTLAAAAANALYQVCAEHWEHDQECNAGWSDVCRSCESKECLSCGAAINGGSLLKSARLGRVVRFWISSRQHFAAFLRHFAPRV